VAVPDADAGRRLHDAVPTTPRRKPFTGDLKEAMATPFPFKKNPELHGRPLSEIATDVLVSTADWCRKTDAAKFGDLIARIETVVHYYLTLEQEQIDADRQDAIERDTLPF